MHPLLKPTSFIHPCWQVDGLPSAKFASVKELSRWGNGSYLHFCITIGSGIRLDSVAAFNICFAVRESAQPYMELSNTQSFPKIGVTIQTFDRSKPRLVKQKHKHWWPAWRFKGFHCCIDRRSILYFFCPSKFWVWCSPQKWLLFTLWSTLFSIVAASLNPGKFVQVSAKERRRRA